LFTAVSFGLWSIVGWIFVPHVLCAVLATQIYRHSNPGLCVASWVIALLGTIGDIPAAECTCGKAVKQKW
jgi:hypothetical protein